MKKIGALSILVVMLTGFLGWAGVQIVENKTQIAGLEKRVDASDEKEERIFNKLDSIEGDIKLLLQRR